MVVHAASAERGFTPAERGPVPTHLDIASFLASRQRGLVTRVELLAAGVSSSAIDRMVADGRLVVVYRGVYALGHLALPAQAFWLAAVLACGPGTVLACRSGAAAWDVRPAPAGFVEVVTRGDRGRHQRGIRTHRIQLTPDEVTVRDGIPVTTWARTMLDLAAAVRVGDVRRALERSEHLQLFDGRALDDVLARRRGQRGAGRFREALAAFDDDAPRTRRELERRMLQLVRRAGVPRPLVNTLVQGHEADLLWRHARLVVELDSWTFHRARPAFERDRRRDVELQAAGYRTVRFTWRQVMREPEWVVSRLRALLSGE